MKKGTVKPASEKDAILILAALLRVKDMKVLTENKPLFGGRVDHAISTLRTMMRPALAPLIPYVVFEDATNVVNFIQPGTRDKKMDFTKYLPLLKRLCGKCNSS